MARPAAPPPIKPELLKGKSIGIIGLGQIGGSIARRLMAYRPDITVYGTDRNTRIAGRVRRYCRWSANLEDMVRAVDIIVLAVPVPGILDYLPQIAESISRTGSSRLIVTDTGTLKYPIQRVAEKHTDQFDYAGIHPLCGTERNGWDAARADLFAGQICICCGDPKEYPAQVAIELIECLGGKLLTLPARQHDRQVALTIGLPHVLAFTANGAAQQIQPDPPLVSGSWRSLARVTASDADMVAGFLSGNKTEQLRIIAEFRRQLDHVEKLLSQSDNSALAATLHEWRSPHRENSES